MCYTADPEFTRNRKIIMEQHDGICYMCGQKAARIHHIDLTTTNHSTENLLPLCVSCHFRVHAIMRTYLEQKSKPEVPPRKIKPRYPRDARLRMAMANRLKELQIPEQLHRVSLNSIKLSLRHMFKMPMAEARENHHDEMLHYIEGWVPKESIVSEMNLLKEAK